MLKVQDIKLPADNVAVFVALDGVIAPFAERPEDIPTDFDTNALLRDVLMRLDTRMAVVSTLSIAEVDRILEGRVVAVAGCSGLQRRDARFDIVSAPPHRRLQQATASVRAFARKFPHVTVEKTPLSVTFYFRQTPEIAPDAEAFAAELARQTGMVLHRGESMYECLPAGMDKGRSVRAFMVEPPFIGAVPLFIGSDLSCEAGFRSASALGGFGILVGPPRETYARFRLRDVADFHRWLRSALASGQFCLGESTEPLLSRL